ncbi:MAG TPA: hypothetical protein VGD67_19410 [Pseudonocardiaceae bacterium]
MTALAALSEPELDKLTAAVENAVEQVIRTVTDEPVKVKLDGNLRKFKAAAGAASMHKTHKYARPDLMIRATSKFWMKLDARTAELIKNLEELGGSAAATSGARTTPWPIIVRLRLPEDETDEHDAPESGTA